MMAGKEVGEVSKVSLYFHTPVSKDEKRIRKKLLLLLLLLIHQDTVVCTSRDGVTRSGSKGVKEKGTNGRGWGKSQAQREKLVATGTSGLVLLEKHWFTGDGAPVGVCIGDLEWWLSVGVGGR